MLPYSPMSWKHSVPREPCALLLGQTVHRLENSLAYRQLQLVISLLLFSI